MRRHVDVGRVNRRSGCSQNSFIHWVSTGVFGIPVTATKSTASGGEFLFFPNPLPCIYSITQQESLCKPICEHKNLVCRSGLETRGATVFLVGGVIHTRCQRVFIGGLIEYSVLAHGQDSSCSNFYRSRRSADCPLIVHWHLVFYQLISGCLKRDVHCRVNL